MNRAVVIIGVGLLAIGLLLGVFVFSNFVDESFDFTISEEEIPVEEPLQSDVVVVEEVIVAKEKMEEDKSYVKDAEPIRLKNVYGLVKALREAEKDDQGQVVLNSEVRYQFNDFCDVYWMRFMPNVDNYQFEYQGAAAWHMFFIWDGEFGRFPEKISDEEMERSLQELFENRVDAYKPFEHRTYLKYVDYENGYYSLVPQSFNNFTGIYDPLEITVQEEGNGYLVTAVMQEYFFDTAGYYELNEQERILAEKADQLGLTLQTTLMEILERGQMDEFEAKRTMELEMFIDSDEIPHIIRFYNGEETYQLD